MYDSHDGKYLSHAFRVIHVLVEYPEYLVSKDILLRKIFHRIYYDTKYSGYGPAHVFKNIWHIHY